MHCHCSIFAMYIEKLEFLKRNFVVLVILCRKRLPGRCAESSFYSSLERKLTIEKIRTREFTEFKHFLGIPDLSGASRHTFD